MIQLDRKQQLVILVLVGAILFGGGYRYAQMKERAAQESKPVLKSPVENKVKELLVHVTGAVTKPGVYQLPQGSRVIDAVNKAGPTGDAQLDALKLASPVIDGQTVYVPSKTAANQQGVPGSGGLSGSSTSENSKGSYAPQPGSAGSGSAAIVGLVNINTADQSQLDTLPGIGPALAQRIIQYRETNGPFKTIEDIKNVSGIGDKNFEKLKDKITVY